MKGRNGFFREVPNMNSFKFCKGMLHSSTFLLPATLHACFTSQFKFSLKNEAILLKKLQQNQNNCTLSRLFTEAQYLQYTTFTVYELLIEKTSLLEANYMVYPMKGDG